VPLPGALAETAAAINLRERFGSRHARRRVTAFRRGKSSPLNKILIKIIAADAIRRGDWTELRP
jgi:hypothetical protein